MATAIVVETEAIGNDAHGQIVEATQLPAQASHVVTYTTSTRILLQPSTRVISVTTDGGKAYLKLGDGSVTAGATDGNFDDFQVANSRVTYVLVRGDGRDYLALYDGSS